MVDGGFKIITVKRLIYMLIALLLISSSYADIDFTKNNDLNSLRSPDQVFKVSLISESNNAVVIKFDIAPGFYIYQHSLKITANPNGIIANDKIKIPNGFEMDIFDGQTTKKEAILNGNFALSIPVISQQAGDLVVSLQGCDGKKICYPEQQYILKINQNRSWISSLEDVFNNIYFGSASDNMALKHTNFIELILVFFIAGVFLALTPCMYPLYPIALSALTGGTAKRQNIIKLTLCYIHGISIVYVLIGVLAATSGKLLTSIIQTPAFVLISSGILLLLGLAMFDLLEIKVPNTINSYVNLKANNIVGGRYTSAFLIGLLSSLLLGPCVTPPLVIAIGFIASVGSLSLGILSLYAMSLGLCLPIFILATMGSRFMPKSGVWMSIVKHLLGVLIIAIAINLAYPLLKFANQSLSVGILCFSVTLIFLIIKHFQSPDLELLTHRVMPILMMVIGLTFTVIGAKQVSFTQATHGNIDIATDVNQVKTAIANDNMPVIIIISAKWCSICREMEATTFKDKSVLNLFKNYVVIDFDITANQPGQISFLNSYNLYGPPAILIFNHSNKTPDILTGFIDVKTLINKLK